MLVFKVLLLSLTSLCAALGQSISVITMQLDLGTPLTIFVSNSVEYILEFRPRVEQQGLWRRMRVSSSGGDETRPLLLVLRQDNGARTWQLPYKSGDRTLFEMDRTLCSAELTHKNDTLCVGPDTTEGRHAFSLHVSTRCQQQLRVTALAYTADVAVNNDVDREVVATLTSAAVLQYKWSREQRGVLLQVSSEDDVCAAVAIQPVTTCPVEEYTSEVSLITMRMSILRAGGIHIERKRFPNGFLIVSMVYPDDVPCNGIEPEDEAWLWEDAVLHPQQTRQVENRQRRKVFTYNITEALSPRMYVVAALVTLLLLLLLYLLPAALLLLRRWPRWRGLVPRAADKLQETEQTTQPQPMRRRDSADTLDGSDVSDTDSEPEEPAVNTNNNQQARPNGVDVVEAAPDTVPNQNPGAINLSVLSRRRNRTLQARANRYPPLLITVCVFYALPVLQLLAAFQFVVNSTGSLDVCYYNFLCSWRLGALADFNHVYSNLAYLLLGALLLVHLARRKAVRRKHPPHPDYGIPEHYGLLSALGVGMMSVALMSAAYHVCPNRVSFQFDTAFMYVLAVLINVKLYQARHPDINARAHATFAALAGLIALGVWGVLGGGALFWSLFTVLHVFSVLLLSLQVYYVGQFKFEKPDLSAARQLSTWRPKYKTRLAALAVGNLANWGLAIYGLVTKQSDFASHLLEVLLANALLHMAYYVLMKVVHKEKIQWYSICITVGAAAAWIPALYFFVSGSSDWSVLPAQSRTLNHRCLILQFYDAHDLWHLLSAVALYLSFCAILTWDDGLAATPREQIPVF